MTERYQDKESDILEQEPSEQWVSGATASIKKKNELNLGSEDFTAKVGKGIEEQPGADEE